MAQASKKEFALLQFYRPSARRAQPTRMNRSRTQIVHLAARDPGNMSLRPVQGRTELACGAGVGADRPTFPQQRH